VQWDLVTRWCPDDVKQQPFARAAGSRTSGLVGKHDLSTEFGYQGMVSIIDAL